MKENRLCNPWALIVCGLTLILAGVAQEVVGSYYPCLVAPGHWKPSEPLYAPVTAVLTRMPSVAVWTRMPSVFLCAHSMDGRSSAQLLFDPVVQQVRVDVDTVDDDAVKTRTSPWILPLASNVTYSSTVTSLMLRATSRPWYSSRHSRFDRLAIEFCTQYLSDGWQCQTLGTLTYRHTGKALTLNPRTGALETL